jgi:hypothetical protein
MLAYPPVRVVRFTEWLLHSGIDDTNALEDIP